MIEIAADTHSEFWNVMWAELLDMFGMGVDEDDIGAYMAGGEL